MAGIKTQEIAFGNGRVARAVFPLAATPITDTLAALSLDRPKAIILCIGGADSLDEAVLHRLTQLYSRGLAKAAVEAGALLISGGTQAGVMALIGEGVAARGNKTPLLGIAPAALVNFPGSEGGGETPLDPNHSHFVLTDGKDWGDETSTLFGVLTQLSMPLQAEKSEKLPVVAVVAGGGNGTREEVLRIVRQNIPLIVMEGSGDFADEVAAARQQEESIEDPLLAEVVADGEIHCFPVKGTVAGLERLVIRELGTDKVLLQSWETFAAYDLNANLQQRRFDRLQIAVIVLGLVGTLLVVAQQVWAPDDGDNGRKSGIIWQVVYHALILVPILMTMLVTASSRFKQGGKWLLLRAGAESIKREIFRYRTRSQGYEKDPEQVLAKRVEDVTRRTMRTEVNLSALVPYDKNKGFPPPMFAAGGSDDGLSRLSPDRYVAVRLADQLNYFTRKTVFYEKQLRRVAWLTFVVGGLGTYLAAVGHQAWVALTTALVAAGGTYLGYRQTENTLMKYNQTATDLANVKAWWDALPPEQQAAQSNINSLVEHTEKVLETELDGWIQNMQNALFELRKGQAAGAATTVTLEKTPSGEPASAAASARAKAAQKEPPKKEPVEDLPQANEETPPASDETETTKTTGADASAVAETEVGDDEMMTEEELTPPAKIDPAIKPVGRFE